MHGNISCSLSWFQYKSYVLTFVIMWTYSLRQFAGSSFSFIQSTKGAKIIIDRQNLGVPGMLPLFEPLVLPCITHTTHSQAFLLNGSSYVMKMELQLHNYRRHQVNREVTLAVGGWVLLLMVEREQTQAGAQERHALRKPTRQPDRKNLKF